MVKETMNIHQALSELKVLGSRIDKAVKETTYCIPNKHSNAKIAGVTIQSYEEIMKSNSQKVDDLVKRASAIKRAVVLSNATTKVTIVGQEYTVAEAIEIKNHGIELKLAVLKKMQADYKQSVTLISRENGDSLTERANDHVIALFGSSEKSKSEECEKAQKTFIEQNSYDLVDPLNILKKIEELEKEIDQFTSEVDSILSTSNALTSIDVEY